MSSRRRLLFRDLAAGAAFAAMAVSGEVPVWATGIFLGALALALFNLRPLERVSSVSAVGLLATLVLLCLSVFWRRTDLVVASCAFAGLISAHRLLSRSTPTTDNQVHLTSLLMLAGGAALSSDLLFAACLVVFALFGTLSLGYSTVGADERPVPSVVTRQLLLGAAFALVGSAVFFFLFPRLSQTAASRRAARGWGTPVTGFSDRVSLDDGGQIKTSPRAVLTARLSPDPGSPLLGAYWVGRAYDSFDGRSWHASGSGHPAMDKVTLRPGSGALIGQRIELLSSYGARTLIALDRPALFGSATLNGRLGVSRVGLVEVKDSEVTFAAAGVSYAYYAYSLPPSEPAPPDRPARPDWFLQLPPKLDPRIAELARSAGGNGDPLSIARNLETYLKTRYAYSLDLGKPTADPLASFLFERREGHCEYFATALTILLRNRGIPARLMTGFYGGERVDDHYVVRAGDAHAWAEALIGGRFVRLDATPEAHRSADASALLRTLAEAYERVETFWRQHVLDYSLDDQVDFARKLSPKAPEGPSQTRHVPWRWLIALVAVLVAWWAARRALLRPRVPETARLRRAIERALDDERRPAEPLEEAHKRLQAHRHPLAPPVSQATRRYLECRFGGEQLSVTERRELVRMLEDARRAARGKDAGMGRA